MPPLSLSREAILSVLSGLVVLGCDKGPTVTAEPAAAASAAPAAPSAAPAAPSAAPAAAAAAAAATPAPAGAVVKEVPAASGKPAEKEKSCAPGGCAPGQCGAKK